MGKNAGSQHRDTPDASDIAERRKRGLPPPNPGCLKRIHSEYPCPSMDPCPHSSAPPN